MEAGLGCGGGFKSASHYFPSSVWGASGWPVAGYCVSDESLASPAPPGASPCPSRSPLNPPPPNHHHLKPISSSGVSDSEPSRAGGRPTSSLIPAYAVSGEDQTRGGVTLRSDPRISCSRPVVSASATGEGMDPHWSDGSVSL